MVTFQDIFKSGFLDRMTGVTLPDMILALGLSFLLGLFIFYVYQKSYCGVMHAASFGITLIAMTMITTILILAVSSNVVLSLGMVGALSIVRFRAAIKEPLDIAFLFWSIAAGIVLAAGLIPLAVLGSLLIGIVMIIFSGQKSMSSPYILVLHCQSAEQEKQVEQLLKERVKKWNLKSKSVAAGRRELNYEIRLRGEETDFVGELAEMPGVEEALLVSYNGDYLG